MIEEVRSIRALIDTLPEGARPYFEGGLSTTLDASLRADPLNALDFTGEISI